MGRDRRYLALSSAEAEEVLREIRLECYGWDSRELARLTGLSRSTIYTFRSGRTMWPRYTTLFPILDVLGYKIRLTR